jgi:hypothetical protein
MRTSTPLQLIQIFALIGFLFGSIQVSLAQDFVVINEPETIVTIEKPDAPVKREALPSVYRFHKRLPAMYNGFAIEIAFAEYPMSKTAPIFRKFGKVKYHKLPEGGYSYLVTTDFKNREDAFSFFKNIIKPKVETAKLIRYEYGVRRQP